MALRDRHGVWGALILGRGRDAPAFDDADLATAASLAQPLGDALRRLHVTRQAWRNPVPTAPSTTGIRCCTRAPRPVRGSAGLLGDDRAPLGGRHTGPPPSLCAAAAAVRTAAAAGGSLTSWVHTRTLGPARLHAWSLSEGHSPSRAVGQDEAVVAVAIEPARPEERTSFLVTAHGLTPRERAVTELVLRGHATAEIGRQHRFVAAHRPGPPQGGVRQDGRAQPPGPGSDPVRTALRACP